MILKKTVRCGSGGVISTEISDGASTLQMLKKHFIAIKLEMDRSATTYSRASITIILLSLSPKRFLLSRQVWLCRWINKASKRI